MSLIAIGHALIINPDWVSLIETGKASEIEQVLSVSKLKENAIPDKLWNYIQSAKGWFDLAE